MNEDAQKMNHYVSHQELKEVLSEQAGIIIDAVDKMLAKQSREVNDNFVTVNNRIEGLREELYTVRDELKHDINNVQALIDGYVKAQEDFKQEFIIMKEEVKQIKQIIKDKLGIEVRAIQ